MEYRTITGVELVQVGMEWHAASGVETFTFENLTDAVAAANEDPHVIDARVKLGHTSTLNEGENFNPFAALGDAEPAFGRVVNLRVANDAVLLGDFVEVPDWLADAIPSAYPNRSIEARRMVETEGGKRYSMVLTAVALLGTVPPAVSSLDELERFLIEGPSGVAASNPNPEEGAMPEVAASVDVGTIRERFNFEWAMSEPVDGLDTYWWWCISVRVDPNEVIADDDEGGLWSIPFSTDGKDGVEFSEPVRVRQEFVPVEASAVALAAARNAQSGQQVLASKLDRPEKPEPGSTTAASRPDTEENEMDIDLAALRSRLGLPDDATEEQINEALAAEPDTPEGGAEGEPAGEGAPAPAAEGEGEPEGEPAEPVAASRGVTLDKDAVEQLKTEAAEGREAREVQLAADRKSIVEAAADAGKFPPSAKASYLSQLETGGEIEASTRKFIEELPANTVPVEEIGVAAESDTGWKDRVMSSFPGHKGRKQAA